ncbi:hypothetical protein JOC75_002686 [Metabacillus crassostreae]|nr:hypothetical protein [Metabacillus crassostreae]MBM7604683.1 hypothetical protein [Metabacillus crassostreae]
MMRLTKCIFLFLLVILLGTGCIPSHQQEHNKELSSMRELPNDKKEVTPQFFGEEVLTPLQINEALFHSVADWKDNNTILYILNNAQSSEVHTYNIHTGKTSLFYKSEFPILQVEANEDHDMFLIHTSPSNYEAELVIVNEKAELLYTTRIESFELNYIWNHLKGDQLFISSFKEDWTYDTYVLNVNNQKMTKNQIHQPFIQWLDEKHVSYLKWDQEKPSLTAPLFVYNIENQSETLIAEHVVANTNFTGFLSTIELVDANGDAAVRFYNNENNEQLMEMPTRLVSLYSDWSVPYLDMDLNKDILYMLEVNEAKTEFSLVSFSTKTEEKNVLIQSIENLPIKLSPSGEYALYGGRFEKIINLNKVSIEELITFN